MVVRLRTVHDACSDVEPLQRICSLAPWRRAFYLSGLPGLDFKSYWTSSTDSAVLLANGTLQDEQPKECSCSTSVPGLVAPDNWCTGVDQAGCLQPRSR